MFDRFRFIVFTFLSIGSMKCITMNIKVRIKVYKTIGLEI